jgi:hypothetical protein
MLRANASTTTKAVWEHTPSNRPELTAIGVSVNVYAPKTNVDRFRHRPVREVAALLANEHTAMQAFRAVQDAGIAVTGAQILYGPEGVRILDINGNEHGYATRVIRALQKIGYDKNLLAIYDEGLRNGEALLTVGCKHEDALPVAAILLTYEAHGMVWFGKGLAEQLGTTP